MESRNAQTPPASAVAALQQRAALFDEVGHFMGDTSTDMSWYTKRATLGAVYSATELFMITGARGSRFALGERRR
jgi:ubiquinone biosynthesis protein COQ9